MYPVARPVLLNSFGRLFDRRSHLELKGRMEKLEKDYKRINVLIRPDQYNKVQEAGLSLSGLIRDLLDDRFSDTKIILSLSRRSKKLYDMIISNFGAADLDLERYIIEALDKFLLERSGQIETIRKQLKDKDKE